MIAEETVMYTRVEIINIIWETRSAMHRYIESHPIHHPKQSQTCGPPAIRIKNVLKDDVEEPISEELGNVLESLGWVKESHSNSYVQTFQDIESNSIKVTEDAFEAGVKVLNCFDILAERIWLPV